MKTDTIDLTLYLFFVIAGFILRLGFENYSKHKNATRLEAWRLKVKELEDRLSLFFWPLYFRLKRGEEAWKSNNLRTDENDSQKKLLADSFDKEVIIENHRETKEIIQKYYYLAGGDKELEESIIVLLHHIDIYIALRKADLWQDPIWVGAPFPEDVVALIEKRLQKHQNEYEDVLSQANSFL